MLSFFLRYLRQKSGRYICVQLLQTLNILFENISNETSLCKYYVIFKKSASAATFSVIRAVNSFIIGSCRKNW